jgi:hypothetical protein
LATTVALASCCCAAIAFACEKAPETTVAIENRYPQSPTNALVIYRASYKEIGETRGTTGAAFDQPIPPVASSEPQSVVSASENTAYVLLAPGWDPASSAPPTSFIVMQSRVGFALRLNETLRIPVDDTTFAGNCAVGSFLTQPEADFITQRIFPTEFATFGYDAASCTTIVLGNADAN